MFTRLFVSLAVTLISLAATVILCAPSCPANPHTRSATPSTQEQSQLNVPRKFDQYGQVGECDEGARLDNFAIQLQNEPTSNGHLFKLEQIIERGQNLLVSKCGVPAGCIKTIFGGYRDVTTVELWINAARR